MKIIPVLDIKAGQVVRGVAGRRSEYRPVVSKLTNSSDPLEVARAFRRHFNLFELYLADLDALGGASPAIPLFKALLCDGFRLWVDAGVRNTRDCEILAAAGISQIVVGLETVDGPAALAGICAVIDTERLIFSLDIKEGKILTKSPEWKDLQAYAIACEVIALGVHRLIVLDLSRVGVGQGIGTESLCSRLSTDFPRVQIIAGGGIRDGGDLRRLENCGVSAVLVASAFHDGRLTNVDLMAEN